MVGVEERGRGPSALELAGAHEPAQADDLLVSLVSREVAEDLTVPNRPRLRGQGRLDFRQLPLQALQARFELCDDLGHLLILACRRPESSRKRLGSMNRSARPWWDSAVPYRCVPFSGSAGSSNSKLGSTGSWGGRRCCRAR